MEEMPTADASVVISICHSEELEPDPKNHRNQENFFDSQKAILVMNITF